MADPWKGQGGDLAAPGRRLAAITPGSSDLQTVAKALVVLTGGNATIIPADNTDAETFALTGLVAGQIINIVTRRVTAATATLAAVVG